VVCEQGQNLQSGPWVSKAENRCSIAGPTALKQETVIETWRRKLTLKKQLNSRIFKQSDGSLSSTFFNRSASPFPPALSMWQLYMSFFLSSTLYHIDANQAFSCLTNIKRKHIDIVCSLVRMNCA